MSTSFVLFPVKTNLFVAQAAKSRNLPRRRHLPSLPGLRQLGAETWGCGITMFIAGMVINGYHSQSWLVCGIVFPAVVFLFFEILEGFGLFGIFVVFWEGLRESLGIEGAFFENE